MLRQVPQIEVVIGSHWRPISDIQVKISSSNFRINYLTPTKPARKQFPVAPGKQTVEQFGWTEK
jgi:hypothetical protein